MLLSGWGNYPKTQTQLLRARGENEIQTIAKNTNSLIVRGNGRAYGDAALNANATLSLLRSDRILSFDETTGLLTCEAGLLLADLLDIFVPRGWFIPVTPGTKFVTIGGMIAADVHGKNHHHSGSFANSLDSFTLLLANGATITCSRHENPELFAATCGGMGLTGIILTASFQLRPIESAYIRQTTIRTKNLAETMQAFEQHQAATYSVAWIDCLSRGDTLGRAIIHLGEHATRSELTTTEPLTSPRKKSCAIPFNLPSFLLNRYSIAAFNTFYYAAAREGTATIDYDRYFYPLDRVHNWNRIYGRPGFVQYQCVLPKAASAAGIAQLLQRIRQAGLGSFLAVLKLLGPGNRYLSFPMEGYTLALDFPATAEVFALLNELDAIVAAHNGRIYLAKDARMSSAMLRSGYSDLDAFLALRNKVDPHKKFSSLQSQRLGL